MPYTTKDHAACRLSVCCLCLKKSECVLNGRLKDLIVKFAVSCFAEICDDLSIPAGICMSCRMKLTDKERGRERDISVPNLFRICKMTTRSIMTKTDCICIVCQVGKARHNQIVDTTQYIQDSKLPNSLPIRHPNCPDCFGPLVPGIAHQNCASEAVYNLQQLVPPHQLEQLVSKVVKDKKAVAGCSKIQLKTGGPPLTISVGAIPKTVESVKHNLFSHQDLLSIQKENKLSDRQTANVAKDIRVVAGRSSVEPGFKQVQVAQNRVESEFFHVQNLQFLAKGEDGKDTDLVQPAVLCTDVMKLVRFVIKERDVDPRICLVKLNIDGGRNFFKIGFSLIESASVNLSPIKGKRMRYSDGVAPRQHKSTSADRMQLLAIVPNIAENRHNVQLVLDSLTNLPGLEFTVSSDLKVLNILSGVQQASCKHPCPYCHWTKQNGPRPSHLRTFGSNRKHHDAWRSSGGKMTDLMKHFNCVGYPLLSDADNILVLDKMPPPELHLLLGLVNHIYNSLEKEWPEVERWAVELGISRRHQPAFSFAGNQCRLLLRKLDVLKSLSPPRKVFKFIEAFEKLNDVVAACFSHSLHHDYKVKIHQFETVYRTLEISEIVKAHILFRHVPQFLEAKDHGLALYSEQAAESIHYAFWKVWEKYKVDPNNADFGNRVLRAVLDFNGKNLK
jgi:hypothetical protein